MNNKTTKKADSLGPTAKRLMEVFTLPQLYRLVNLLSESTEKRISLFKLRFSEVAPSTDDVMAVFEPLLRAFPELREHCDLDGLASAVVKTCGKGAELASSSRRRPKSLADVGKTRRRYRKAIGALESVPRVLRQEALKMIETGNWDRLEKAETFLLVTAETAGAKNCGDLEALVYLASRKRGCNQMIRALVQNWREAEERHVQKYSQGHEILDVGSGKRRRVGTMPLEDARKVALWNSRLLENFWHGEDREKRVLDATMLRTVEWCEIGGFDDWWARWAKEVTEGVLHGGGENTPDFAVWLFGLLRSGMAVKLLGTGMATALTALQYGEPEADTPWRVQYYGSEGCVLRDSVSVAATMLFGASIAGRCDSELALLERAANFLLRSQQTGGPWPIWADEGAPSIQETAMVVHALALNKPRGWEHAAKNAADWLWSVQEPTGCWSEMGADGCEAFLTVLVLDAIELAEGGTRVTFSPPECQDAAVGVGHEENDGHAKGGLVGKRSAKEALDGARIPKRRRKTARRRLYVLAQKAIADGKEVAWPCDKSTGRKWEFDASWAMEVLERYTK